LSSLFVALLVLLVLVTMMLVVGGEEWIATV
jgi:hypothetical protein